VIAQLRNEKLVEENKVHTLNRELEKLREYLNACVKELEEWKSRYTELESLREDEISELRTQFDTFRRANIDLKELQVKFGAERTAYETQILQMRENIVDLENEVESLMNENDRVLSSSINKKRELDQLKRSRGQVDEDHALEVGGLKSQIEMYKSNTFDVKQLAIKYSAEKAADMSQIKQLKQMNDNYRSELEKLYELLNQRKIDYDDLVQQNEELRRMYERQSIQIKDQSGNFESHHYQLETMKAEIRDLEQAKELYRNQAERNSTELTRKNRDLVDKIQELDILKVKYEEALANYQALNTKLYDKLKKEGLKSSL